MGDLGTESATPWAREKLYQLLNHRYEAALPTVITTSKTREEIDPWVLARMDDRARCTYVGIRARGYYTTASQRTSTPTRRKS